MSQLLLTVLEAIHLCTEPHNTHKTAPKQLSSHPSSTGMEPRASGVLDNCSTTEPHPPGKNALDKFKLPLRSRYEITATRNNLFLSDNQSKPLLCLGAHPTLVSIRTGSTCHLYIICIIMSLHPSWVKTPNAVSYRYTEHYKNTRKTVGQRCSQGSQVLQSLE